MIALRVPATTATVPIDEVLGVSGVLCETTRTALGRTYFCASLRMPTK